MLTNLAIRGKLIFLYMLALYSCGRADPQTLPENVRLLDKLRQEQKVIEAIITDANVLYVSVSDDGTVRNGYADYLCQLVGNSNATSKMVKVVKAGSTDAPDRDNAYGVLLGQSYCK